MRSIRRSARLASVAAGALSTVLIGFSALPALTPTPTARAVGRDEAPVDALTVAEPNMASAGSAKAADQPPAPTPPARELATLAARSAQSTTPSTSPSATDPGNEGNGGVAGFVAAGVLVVIVGCAAVGFARSARRLGERA